MLRLEHVYAGYDGGTVLFDVSLEIERGSVAALVGPNGAGKTTLLRVASGLVRAAQGSVTLDETDISRLTASRITNLGICHIPEGRGIFPSLSVIENLLLFANSNDKGKVRAVALQAFAQLEPLIERQAGTLSGGQQQMLALARTYLQRPAFVLLDELSMGLAPIVVDDIYSFLPRLAARGVGILLVEQYVSRALSMSDHAYVMNKGRVAFQGPSKDLLQDPELFARYLGDGATSVTGP